MNKLIAAAISITAIINGNNAIAGSVQGVTDDAVVIGMNTDLSGPLASWGVEAANGMRLRFEQANHAGGVHGRQIRLIVEDHQYQVPRAIQAGNKLLRKEKVFAFIGSLGTPMNNAVLPSLLKANVPNLFPFTAAKTMALPLNPLKFSYFRPYYDQMRAATKYFKDTVNFKTACIAAVANDGGEEMSNGVVDQLAVYGMKPALLAKHKSTETNFVATVTAMQNAKCDMLFLSTTIKDTILIASTAKKMGWEVPMVSAMVPYIPLVASAAEGAMEGLYVSAPYAFLYEDRAQGEAKKILDAFRAKHDKAMGPQAQLAYVMGDLFVTALEKAGKELTVNNLISAIESIKGYTDPFGGPIVSYDKDDHQGVDALNLVQVKNKRWEVIRTGMTYLAK